MEVQQNNPEVQNDILGAREFIIKASKYNICVSQEIKWAKNNGWYSRRKLNNFLKEEIGFDYYSQGTNSENNINKKLFDTVYEYSINRIKKLYFDTYNYDNEIINGEFNELLNYIWGFLRQVYNAYRRAHTLNKHYKTIKYNFNTIRNKLINYIKYEYNPDYNELERIKNDYIEDFDNHNIYDTWDKYDMEQEVQRLYTQNSPDVDLYKNLIDKYEEIILEMVEEYYNQ